VVLDPVLLSRIQFGLTIGFHFIFPAITLGLTLVIVVLETLAWRRNDTRAKEASAFLIRILGLVFVIGVATGIVMAVTIGTNWSSFARLVGDVFGVALVAEGVFAFFLESTFLGVLLFARGRVSPRMYWLSAVLVALGSHLSGLWILVANSWMQTPAGYAVTGDGIVLTDFWAAFLNPSTGVRFLHTTLASWITGSFFVAGIAAWYLLKGRDLEVSRKMMRVALALLVVSALVMPFAGHLHSIQVANTQPAKLAAYEGLWQTQTNAPLALFGIPNEAAGTTDFYFGIPGLLSVLVGFTPDTRITGLNDIPANLRPPILVSFASYHVMILLGGVFVLFALAGAYLWRTGKLWKEGRLRTWYLRALVLAMPLPILSNEVGWIGAEVGRQPWTVYGVQFTADAVSAVVPDWQILASLLILGTLYALLLLLFLTRLRMIVAKGPAEAGQG
jgi:cytochrome d ubiquinol oxidase subunit I